MFKNVDEVVLNLLENGCRQDIIDAYYHYYIENDIISITYMLRKYRQELQDIMDREGRQIDCLDCMMYEIEHNK